MPDVIQIKNVIAKGIVSRISEKAKETPPAPFAPIGIFDSGVGGLTVLQEIKKQMPHEDVIYVADTARVPYGGRTAKEIINFNHQIISRLIKGKVKLIIMACGTSSAIAYPIMSKKYKVGIVGLIGPGSRAAANATRNGKIGLIATVGTVNSGAYQKRIKEIKQELEIFAEATPLFVPLIEGGLIDKEETKKVAREYLRPLLDKGIDTLILGCTHYPHLKKVIGEIAGPDVVLVDPAENTVKEAGQILQNKMLVNNSVHNVEYAIQVTGSAPPFLDLASKLWGKPLSNVKEIKL
ncbi:MAG: glutamate racemase [bacterium]